jgi:hypothetical protein
VLPLAQPKALPAEPAEPRPTLDINLDLSLLVALLSDLTHSTPPADEPAALARYTPGPAYAARKAARGVPVGDADGLAPHSAALAAQAAQERDRPLLAEMRARLEDARAARGLARAEAKAEAGESGWAAVRFWTTAEARARCLRIVGTIGGPAERRRAGALLGEPSELGAAAAEDASSAFWRGSRYPRAYLPLVPVRVLPEAAPAAAEGTRGAFFAQLGETCAALLEGRTGYAQPALAAESFEQEDVSPGAPNLDRRLNASVFSAPVTRAHAKLTTHTLVSLRVGAARGWATLTANRASVRAVLREVRAQHAVGGSGVDRNMMGGGDGEEGVRGAAAALWVVDPKSLAESMRNGGEDET